jgi:hypothetical protein
MVFHLRHPSVLAGSGALLVDPILPYEYVSSRVVSHSVANFATVRRQIQHMIKYRYVPFSFGKAKYNKSGR